MNETLDIIFRWLHVVAGITWIGHLYFFNFVNAHVAKTYDADSKKKVVPELMPRALYFFRWGAAYTWITGFLLWGIVYPMGGYLLEPDSGFSQQFGSGAVGVASAIFVGILVVGFLIYDVLWKSPLGKNETVATAVSFVLLMVLVAALAMTRVFAGRALYLLVGALFGTIMAGNVWMRIWPAQKKIINGIKGVSPAPDASVAALAGLRSKHNTYMSVPLVFTMVSNHASTWLAHDYNWVIIGAVVLLGWGLTKFLYVKSGSPAPVKV